MARAAIFPTLERELAAWRAGSRWVAGVDEVGSGALAGPVTAAAVALPAFGEWEWFGVVRDSKMLSPEARERLARLIEGSVPWALGWSTAAEVDAVGLTEARRRAAMRALGALGVEPQVVISDAITLPVPGNIAVVRADAHCVSVAAASVVAKVARDSYMTKLCELLPGYAFCRHKGYATADHKEALRRRGPSPEHRRRFTPVSQLGLPW